MGVAITGNNMNVPGNLVANALVLTSLSFSGFGWLPKTSIAYSVNDVPFQFPQAVIRATFAPTEITSLNLTSVDLTSVSGLNTLTNLTSLDISTNSLDFTSLSLPPLISSLDASNNAIPSSGVNSILTQLDANGITNGTVDLSGGTNGAPSGDGATAKANLISKGWSVTTN